MSTTDKAKAKAYEAKANIEDTVEDIADYLPEDASSRKMGLFATLAILSVVGLIVWLVMNSADDA